MRKPAVAGQFYSADKNELFQEIKNCFSHELGPNANHNNSKSVKGIIVPHAGYMFSGPCAAHAYQALKQAKPFDSFIVLGFSHGGSEQGEISLSDEDWQTPLGIAHLDLDLFKALTHIDGCVVDNMAHVSEHSIEVQLPFLQYCFEKVKFAALSVSHKCNYKNMGDRIAKAIKGKNVCIIASSDFTHYGSIFGYTPFGDNTEAVKNQDLQAFEKIKNKDMSGFLDFLTKTGATICGSGPIALQMQILASKPELLKYYTSSEVMKSDSAVSYLSAVYK